MNTQLEKWSPTLILTLINSMFLTILSLTALMAIPIDSRFPTQMMVGFSLILFIACLLFTRFNRSSKIISVILERLETFFSVTTPQLVLLGLSPFFALLAHFAAGDRLLAYQPWVSGIAWGIAILFLITGSQKTRNNPVGFGRIPHIDILLVLAIFIFAFALRGSYTDKYPTTFSGDEASAGLSAVDFITGKANNLFSMGWFSFPSLFYAIESFSIRLFGQTPQALRYFSALGGAATVAALYWLLRTMFNRTYAFFGSLLLAMSHYHIQFSRIGLQNIWDGFFTIVALAALWHGWKKGWRGGFIICGLALGLGQYFYVSFRAVPVIILVWVLIAAPFNWRQFKQRFPDLLLAAWIALLVYLPLALFFLKHPQEYYAPLQRVTVFEGWLTEQATQRNIPEWQVLWQQILLTAKGIIIEPLQHWYNMGKPMLLPLSAALFLMGLVWGILFFDLRHLLILLPTLVTILAGGFSRDAPASQRFILIAPTAAFYIAYPLVQSAEIVGHHWRRWRKIAILVGLLVVSLLGAIDINFYFNQVFNTYLLGGANTETGNILGNYMKTHENEQIYFFGWPRMNYASIAVVPYLAPQITSEDVIDVMEPLTAPPTWPITRKTIFIFLPNRYADLEWVKQQYPNGITEQLSGGVLKKQEQFTTYQVEP